MGLFAKLFGKKPAPAPPKGPSVEKLLAQGKALVAAGEFARAAEEFQRAVRKAPSHPEARYALSRALARAGDRASAAEEFVESIRLSGEVEDPLLLLADAEALGMALGDGHRRRLAAALCAGLAEGRFVFLSEEPYDEEDPALTPEGFFHSAIYRQIRDLTPAEAALSLMSLSSWERREEATACLGEEGFDAFLARFGDQIIIPNFLTCFRLTDLRKYLKRTAVNPARGVDELFYDRSAVAIVDPIRRSIPLLPDRPVEEALLRWFAFKMGAPILEWPDSALLAALASTYEANGNPSRAELVRRRAAL